MIQNFRGKNIKDIETAPETLISNPGLTNGTINTNPISAIFNVTNQQLVNENFDNYIEKKNKKL